MGVKHNYCQRTTPIKKKGQLKLNGINSKTICFSATHLFIPQQKKNLQRIFYTKLLYNSKDLSLNIVLLKYNTEICIKPEGLAFICLKNF